LVAVPCLGRSAERAGDHHAAVATRSATPSLTAVRGGDVRGLLEPGNELKPGDITAAFPTRGLV